MDESRTVSPPFFVRQNLLQSGWDVLLLRVHGEHRATASMRRLNRAEAVCRLRNLAGADAATSVMGTTGSPAAVFDLRIVSVFANKSTSDHCSPFNSQPLAVVLRQRIAVR